MRINQVEQLVGIPKKTIRFYEQEGLLSPSRDSQNGYREYSEEDVAQLGRIKLLRKLAVPIGEIRAIQSGSLTLADGLRRHLISLERQHRNLEQTQRLCALLADSGEVLSTLDAGNYLLEMERMEQKGVSFVNIKHRDRPSRYAASVVAAAVMLGLMGLVAALILWGMSVDPIPLPLAVGLLAIPLAVGVGTMLALIQRLKEIKGGEEDAARKY